MKKLVSIIAVIGCVFGLTACGSVESNTLEGTAISDNATEQYLITYGETLVGEMDTIVRAGGASLYEDEEVYGDAFDSYESSINDIGEIQDVDNEQVVIDDEGNYVINIGIVGTEHGADVVITLDEEAELTSISTNVRYSMGELLQQGALNTVLGMGTTFVVLILLALIIYCFRFINVFQQKKEKKAAAKKEAENPAPKVESVNETATQEAEPEEVEVPKEDEAQLIAVISAAIAADREDEGVQAKRTAVHAKAEEEIPYSAGKSKVEGFVARTIRKSRKKD